MAVVLRVPRSAPATQDGVRERQEGVQCFHMEEEEDDELRSIRFRSSMHPCVCENNTRDYDYAAETAPISTGVCAALIPTERTARISEDRATIISGGIGRALPLDGNEIRLRPVRPAATFQEADREGALLVRALQRWRVPSHEGGRRAHRPGDAAHVAGAQGRHCTGVPPGGSRPHLRHTLRTGVQSR